MSMAMNRIKQSPKSLFLEVGQREGLSSEQLYRFYEFMNKRFPDERDANYIATWANRVKSNSVMERGDKDTRKAWTDVMKTSPRP